MENEKIKKLGENELSNMSKESKIVLFLVESKDIKSKKEIEKLYLDKYKLNEKSNSINIRVIERFLGVYGRYSKEKKEEKVKILKESLVKSKIDYKDLVERYKEVKEKSKRSNRLNSNFMEIEV